METTIAEKTAFLTQSELAISRICGNTLRAFSTVVGPTPAAVMSCTHDLISEV
jgi:hypothetical protein